jgi:RNA 2',3'-cyclic 3'-phosphodiesterase
MFVALVPPEEAVADLERFLSVRRHAAAFRWARPEQFHVTLAFFASVPDRSLEALVEGLESAAARRTPFDTSVAGGGAFPNVAQARVLWAGLALAPDSEGELGRLSAGARTAGTRAGTAVDGQRFRPHITVARLGFVENVTRWVQLLEDYRGPSWRAVSVELVASHLVLGKRPRHEVVAECPLGPVGS